MRVYRIQRRDGTVVEIGADYAMVKGRLTDGPPPVGGLRLQSFHPDLMRKNDEITFFCFPFSQRVN